MVEQLERRRYSDDGVLERITKLEVKSDYHTEQMNDVINQMTRANDKLEKIYLVMAEGRGFAKLGKYLGHAITGALGGIATYMSMKR